MPPQTGKRYTPPLEPLTPPQQSEMWALINGVEAAMRMRGISLEHELEQIDRDLEDLFRPNQHPM